MKKVVGFIFSRFTIVSLILLLQLAALVILFYSYHEYYYLLYLFNLVLSFSILLYIINDSINPSYKIIWIMSIFTLPFFGILIYLLFGGKRYSKKIREKLKEIEDKKKEVLKETLANKKLKEIDIDAYLQAKYVLDYANYPVYQNTRISYFKIGEEYYKNLIEQLKKAERFIFIEYFIIEQGIFWDDILEVLKEKAKNGVDVRVTYDDWGTILTLPSNYHKTLRKYGIKCTTFNRYIPVLSSRINNRDHRKITVIDGKVAFTGGINLADEYINEKIRYGHWKDNGIMLEGEAVFNMTVMFLSTWDYSNHVSEDYYKFKVDTKIKNDSFILPYDDSPYDGETVGKNIYLNLINRAKKYIYITTPYLIVDDEFINAISKAAKSGIDVKILVPGIADKKTVNEVTKSHYEELLKSGVSIYEYELGFTHAKTFIVDDLYSIVGTVNLDYRSLYLHFENGVLMYNDKSLVKIKKDFNDTLKHSKLVTLEEHSKQSIFVKLRRAILKVFSPLL